MSKNYMSNLKTMCQKSISVLVSGMVLSMVLNMAVSTTAFASQAPTGQVVVDVKYAQDFAYCANHFYQGTPPVIGVDFEIYPLCFGDFATLSAGVSQATKGKTKFYKTTLYSAHHLTRDEVTKARQLPRQDNFHAETRLPSQYQATNDEYKNSGYDRGHLVPNGDMKDVTAQFDSFSLANIVPQNGEHNRGVWRQIESHTRYLAMTYGEIYVVTGVAFDDGTSTEIGNTGIIVPDYLYKAIYIPSTNTAGVYYSANDASLSHTVLSLDDFAQKTGVQAFVKAPTAQFDPKIFDINTSRVDNTDDTVSDDEIWAMIVQLIIQIWQALTG